MASRLTSLLLLVLASGAPSRRRPCAQATAISRKKSRPQARRAPPSRSLARRRATASAREATAMRHSLRCLRLANAGSSRPPRLQERRPRLGRVTWARIPSSLLRRHSLRHPSHQELSARGDESTCLDECSCLFLSRQQKTRLRERHRRLHGRERARSVEVGQGSGCRWATRRKRHSHVGSTSSRAARISCASGLPHRRCRRLLLLDKTRGRRVQLPSSNFSRRHPRHRDRR